MTGLRFSVPDTSQMSMYVSPTIGVAPLILSLIWTVIEGAEEKRTNQHYLSRLLKGFN